MRNGSTAGTAPGGSARAPRRVSPQAYPALVPFFASAPHSRSPTCLHQADRREGVLVASRYHRLLQRDGDRGPARGRLLDHPYTNETGGIAPTEMQ